MGRLAEYWRSNPAVFEAQGYAQRGASWDLPNRGDAYPPGTIYPEMYDPNAMDFRDDVVLDPSQTEWRGAPSLGEQTNATFGGFGPYGGGGGGSWLYGGGGLFGQLGMILAMMGGGAQPDFTGAGGPLSGVGTGSSSTGFTASPPGTDFGGYDVTPDNLVRWQGLLGIPQAIRTLRVAERRLGLPGLSDAVTGEGYRSHEQQAALYAQHLAGTHPAPVAPPGQSYHEQGEAFDIASSWLAANPTAQPWLERHGFTWDVPGEPWHAHYVGGGKPLFPATGNQGRPIPSESHRVSSSARPEDRAEFMRRRQRRY